MTPTTLEAAAGQRAGTLVLAALSVEIDRVAALIDELEAASYEPARRDSGKGLREVLAIPRAIGSVAYCDGILAGISVAAPLESFGHALGGFPDDEFGKHSTLYFVDTTVDSRMRRRGIGRALKVAQLGTARVQGYRYASGRNRVVLADGMLALNISLGGRILTRIANAYSDGIHPDSAHYYRITL
jgi:GNAT superfamily N-acetyltransferase